MSEARVRYKDKPEVCVTVRLIMTWKRGDIPHQTMSTSGGPKDQIRNQVWQIFDELPVDAVSMVRRPGCWQTFFIMRKGQTYYDITGAEVQVKQIGV